MAIDSSHTKNIAPARLRRIAHAAEIPEEQWHELEVWLRNLIARYQEETRIYEDGLTKKQKEKHVEKLNEAARALRDLLRPPWIRNYMASYDALAMHTGDEDPPLTETMEKVEQVERDVSGVDALVRRSAAMAKDLNSRLANADEQSIAASAKKQAIICLHKRIGTYWMALVGKPTFAEESAFVNFVRVVYGLVGLSEEASLDTIRGRHKASLR